MPDVGGYPCRRPKVFKFNVSLKENYTGSYDYFFRYWRQSMEDLVLNSLEFTPASTSPASSLVVWVKMDAKVWELWF